MSTTDLTTPIATGSADPASDTPFVRVFTDPDTGRAVIALDAAAIAALRRYLDDIGPGYDLAVDPGAYGVDDDDATRISDVVSRVSSGLSKLSA